MDEALNPVEFSHKLRENMGLSIAWGSVVQQ